MLSIFNIIYVLTFQTQRMPSLVLRESDPAAEQQAQQKSATLEEAKQ